MSKKKVKWVDFDKHPPTSEHMVYLQDDGTGKQSGRMRIPCQHFTQLREKYPNLKIRYRRKSTPAAGHEVRFQYPVENQTDTGVVLSRDGEHLNIQCEVMEGTTLHIIEIDRYLEEVTVLDDERFNEKYGR